MYQEMTREERREMSHEIALEEFMRELVEILAKRFEEQKSSVGFLKSVADDMKDEMTSIRQEVQEMRQNVIAINESITKLTERQNKISRDILGAIID